MVLEEGLKGHLGRSPATRTKHKWSVCPGVGKLNDHPNVRVRTHMHIPNMFPFP